MTRCPTRSYRRVRRDSDLSCPVCGTMLAVPVRGRFEGAAVRCLYCGAEPVLARERQEHTDRYRWILVDPEEELDDERRA